MIKFHVTLHIRLITYSAVNVFVASVNTLYTNWATKTLLRICCAFPINLYVQKNIQNSTFAAHFRRGTYPTISMWKRIHSFIFCLRSVVLLPA